MAKFNFNVQGVDHKKAAQNFESPKPGMYRAKVAEMNPGFSKDEAGKPDQSRPRIEVVFHLQDKIYDQTPMWYFLTFGDGYPKVKLDQFLQAVGVNTARKSKGTLDTDSLIGKIVNVRVRAGENQSGEYRGEVGGVFAASQEDEDLDEDEEELDEEEEALDEDEDEEEAEDEDDGLDALSIKEIRALAKEKGLDSTGVKATVIERIRAAASETEEEEESEEEDEDETEDDGYDELSVAELKQEFKDRDLELPAVKGPVAKQKVALIAALRANDEEPF